MEEARAEIVKLNDMIASGEMSLLDGLKEAEAIDREIHRMSKAAFHRHWWQK